jgi:hypothetical protein
VAQKGRRLLAAPEREAEARCRRAGRAAGRGACERPPAPNRLMSTQPSMHAVARAAAPRSTQPAGAAEAARGMRAQARRGPRARARVQFLTPAWVPANIQRVSFSDGSRRVRNTLAQPRLCDVAPHGGWRRGAQAFGLVGRRCRCRRGGACDATRRHDGSAQGGSGTGAAEPGGAAARARGGGAARHETPAALQ